MSTMVKGISVTGQMHYPTREQAVPASPDVIMTKTEMLICLLEVE